MNAASPSVPAPATAGFAAGMLPGGWAPNWKTDGRDWPNRSASRFVQAGSLAWHVQVAGDGPVVLLLHGTGASTHSWRALFPLLARRYTVVAPDLPGHGFTALPPAAQMSLEGVTRHLASLLKTLGIAPSLVVGHSAGAAIAARLALDGRAGSAGLLSLNGALIGLEGATGVLYPTAARLLSAMPLVARIASLHARHRQTMDRLLASTGSRIDPVDAAFYTRLMARPRHVAGALRMMANWNLHALDLGQLRMPAILVAGERDRMVPPDVATRVARQMKQARVVMLPGLGHLAHEEDPAAIAALVDELARGGAAAGSGPGGDLVPPAAADRPAA